MILVGFSAGPGPAGQLLQFAKLPSPQEALKLGLVDRIVPSAQLLPAAEAVMADALKLPDWGRQVGSVCICHREGRGPLTKVCNVWSQNVC